MDPVLFESISIKTSKEEGIKEGGIKLFKKSNEKQTEVICIPHIINIVKGARTVL